MNAPALHIPPSFASGLWNPATAALMAMPRRPRPFLEPPAPPRAPSLLEQRLLSVIDERIHEARRLLTTRPSFPWTGPAQRPPEATAQRSEHPDTPARSAAPRASLSRPPRSCSRGGHAKGIFSASRHMEPR